MCGLAQLFSTVTGRKGRKGRIFEIHSNGNVKVEFDDGGGRIDRLTRDKWSLAYSEEELASKVRDMLTKGADVNGVGELKKTALQLAMDWDAGLLVVDALLEGNADIASVNVGKLVHMVMSTGPESVKRLSEASAKVMDGRTRNEVYPNPDHNRNSNP